MKSSKNLNRFGILSLMALFGCGSSAIENDNSVEILQQELSEVEGCHFYVGSNYGGSTLHMKRGETIIDLKFYGMGDKISSVRLRGGASTRMWIDSNYRGASWFITNDVPTLHTSSWGSLGDNASSIDCY
jgi:hypothetical protein